MPAGSRMKASSVLVATRTTQNNGKSTAITAVAITSRGAQRCRAVSFTAASPLVRPAEASDEELGRQQQCHDEHADDGDGGGEAEPARLDARPVDLEVEGGRGDARAALREAQDPREERGDRPDRQQQQPEAGDRSQGRSVDVEDQLMPPRAVDEG